MRLVRSSLSTTALIANRISESSAFSTGMINGIYIPSALLVLGTFIVKKEWVPFALALAAVLSSGKLLGSSALAPLRQPTFYGITCS